VHSAGCTRREKVLTMLIFPTESGSTTWGERDDGHCSRYYCAVAADTTALLQCAVCDGPGPSSKQQDRTRH
jgi:hypothetical protein